MLGLAVCEGQLDIIKYLVTECSVGVNGEQSVYVSPVICGVCEHLYTCTLHMSSHSHSIICEVVSFIIFITSSGGLSTAHADS